MQLWRNWNFQKSTSKRDEKLNLGSKEKAKHYTPTEITECNKRYIVCKLLASLLSLIAKGLNRMPKCKRWLILLFQKNDITKFPWGRLGALPHNFFGCGGDRPHRLHGIGAYGADRSLLHIPQHFSGGATLACEILVSRKLHRLKEPERQTKRARTERIRLR